MAYKISRYSYIKAKTLGVTIKPSTNPHKKIDVFKAGIKVASIGDPNYFDYPTYLKMEKEGYFSPGYADDRRRNYHRRHRTTSRRKFSPSYYAKNILW